MKSCFAGVQLISGGIDPGPIPEPAPGTRTGTAGDSDYIFIDGFEDLCEQDGDKDDLPDCVETGTHVYVNQTDTGTDRYNSDTDGDALRDGDEVFGTAGGLNLPGMGANPLHKDVLIEDDWFDDALECAAHSHRPSSAVMQQVHDFYASAPVANPDGVDGINAIQDYGQGGLFTGGNLIPDTDGWIVGTGYFPEFQAYEATYFASNRKGYFHYGILPHRYQYGSETSSSGWGGLQGYEFMVSLYCAYSYGNNLRNTIVHELGHNFNLNHGGGNGCNYKWNYNSIMNYHYQFDGVDTDCQLLGDGALDYSHGTRRALDENNLNETLGMCTDRIVPIDWNGDGEYTTLVAVDINSYSNQAAECGSALSILSDFNDWGYLKFDGITRSRNRNRRKVDAVCPPAPQRN